MEPRDWTAIAGILVGVIGLIYGTRASLFQRAAKTAELRAAVLGEMLSTVREVQRCRRLLALARTPLKNSGLIPPDHLENFEKSVQSFDEGAAEFEERYKAVAVLRKSDWVMRYETMFHEAKDLSARVSTLAVHFQDFMDELEEAERSLELEAT